MDGVKSRKIDISTVHDIDRAYQYKKTERKGKTEYYHVSPRASHQKCCCCGWRDTTVHRTNEVRRIHGLPIGLKKRLFALMSGVFTAGSAVHSPENVSIFARIALGQTKGFKRHRADYYQYHARPKKLWVYPLHPKACELLQSIRLPEPYAKAVNAQRPERNLPLKASTYQR